MASLQRDLADELVSGGAGDCPGACVKLNRRSLGGLAFDIQFVDETAAAAETAGAAAAAASGPDSPGRKARCHPPPAALAHAGNSSVGQLSTDEIAERLAAAELRREQQLAERVGKLETQLSHVSEVSERRKREVEKLADTSQEMLRAAEERRTGRLEEVKQRARGQSAGAKERCEAVREHQESVRQALEAKLESDIREKEARRREQLGRIVQGAQQHLARVEGVRSQRLSGAEILPDD